MDKQRIIIDCDPGVDDCMAMIMAFYEPSLEVEMISTTFGNIGIEQATKNALFIVQNYADKPYPVYMGAPKGINTPLHNAEEVHGKNGLGTKIIAKNVRKKIANKEGYGAIEAMRDTINKYPHEVTIVSIGPVTNVANLFLTYPEVISKIKRVVLMVGSMDGKGSITPYASFNAYCDPDAVAVVIAHEKEVPITISTKEMGTIAYFEEDQRKRFAKCGRLGQVIYDLCEGYVDKILVANQYAVHDTCALFSILDGDYFTRTNVKMSINLTNNKKRAQTKFKESKNSNISLLLTVDKQKVFKKMENILKKS